MSSAACCVRLASGCNHEHKNCPHAALSTPDVTIPSRQQHLAGVGHSSMQDVRGVIFHRQSHTHGHTCLRGTCTSPCLFVAALHFALCPAACSSCICPRQPSNLIQTRGHKWQHCLTPPPPHTHLFCSGLHNSHAPRQALLRCQM
jgi:hypothetical protein